MKIAIVRIALLACYVLATLVNLTLVPRSYDLWACILASFFSIAIVLFTGRAPVFVLVSVFLASCALPVAALTLFVGQLYDSWIDSFSSLIREISTNNPLHGLELIAPLFVAAISMTLAQRWRSRRDNC